MIYEVEILETKVYNVKVVMNDEVIHKDKIVERAREILESDKESHFVTSQDETHIIQNVS